MPAKKGKLSLRERLARVEIKGVPMRDRLGGAKRRVRNLFLRPEDRPTSIGLSMCQIDSMLAGHELVLRINEEDKKIKARERKDPTARKRLADDLRHIRSLKRRDSVIKYLADTEFKKIRASRDGGVSHA